MASPETGTSTSSDGPRQPLEHVRHHSGHQFVFQPTNIWKRIDFARCPSPAEPSRSTVPAATELHQLHWLTIGRIARLPSARRADLLEDSDEPRRAMADPDSTCPTHWGRPRKDRGSRFASAGSRSGSPNGSRRCPRRGWDAPAPCEGWVARDVVRHLVEWFPAFFLTIWEVPQPVVPSVDDDPAGAWAAVRDAIQDALDDPEVEARERDTPLGSSFAVGDRDRRDSRRADPHLGPGPGDRARRDPRRRRDQPPRREHRRDAVRGHGIERALRARVPAAAGADDQTRVLNAFGRRP